MNLETGQKKKKNLDIKNKKVSMSGTKQEIAERSHTDNKSSKCKSRNKHDILKSRTKVELCEMLKKKQLPVSGTKQELVERLCKNNNKNKKTINDLLKTKTKVELCEMLKKKKQPVNGNKKDLIKRICKLMRVKIGRGESIVETEIIEDPVKIIEYYTFNDSNYIKYNGEFLKTILEDKNINHSGICFEVLQAFALVLPALKQQSQSHDNISTSTIFVCSDDSTKSGTSIKIAGLRSAKTYSESSSKRDRASLASVIIEIMNNKKSIAETNTHIFVLDIVKMIMSDVDWKVIREKTESFNSSTNTVVPYIVDGSIAQIWEDNIKSLEFSIFKDLLYNLDSFKSIENLGIPNKSANQIFYEEDMKFGFEYEVLVKVINKTFHKLVKLMQKSKTDSKIRKTMPCYKTDFEDKTLDWKDSKIKRFVFATILQSTTNVEFQATSSNKSIICKVPRYTNYGTLDYTRHWLIEEDPSVYCSDPSKCKDFIENIEIVSPILSFFDVKGKNNTSYFTQVFNEILTATGSFEYHTNETTSNHVHISNNDNFNSPEILFKCIMAWILFEPVFMTFVSESRKPNQHCFSLTKRVSGFNSYGKLVKCQNADEFNELISYVSNLSRIPGALKENEYPTEKGDKWGRQDDPTKFDMIKYFTNHKRYYAINLYNLSFRHSHTIEVRLKHGSTDVDENKNWMLLLSRFFLYAMNNNCVTRTYANLFPGVKDIIKVNELIDPFWAIIDDTNLKMYWTTFKPPKTLELKIPTDIDNYIAEHL